MRNGNNEENEVTLKTKENVNQRQDIFYKEMFELMIQNAPVSMYILENWTYSYVNNHFCDLIGYTKEELFNEKITTDKLVHPDDLAIVQESVRKRMENRETDARYQVRVIKKDGSIIYVEIHASKTIMDGKSVTFGTVFDVTEEVKANLLLKENQERFKSLFNDNPDAIFTFDMEGNFTDANPGCCDLTGYTPDELLEMSFAPLIVNEDLTTALYYFEEAIRGNTNRYEISIIPKDGQRRDLEVTCFPMKQAGDILGAYGIAKISRIEMRIENLWKTFVL